VRFAFLESGGGWMAAWLDRMDRHFDESKVWGPPVRTKPSEIFRRQCWISFEPIEGTIASMAEYLGPNKILWATDYPHLDGFFPGAPAMIAEKLPPNIRRQVMAQGAIDFYNLR
jgi:predicted TIM-barrel fold metal-dependent hydrolase